MSQEGLAELIGITRVHMNRIENGKHTPRPETLARIVDALECPESLVADDEEERLLTVDPRDFGGAMQAIFDRAMDLRLEQQRERVSA